MHDQKHVIEPLHPIAPEEGLRLMKAFWRIERKEDREHIILMVEKYVDVLSGKK